MPVLPRKNGRSKYGNIKCSIGEKKFDSRLEARRFSHLKFMEMAGEIKDLQTQVRFPIIYNDIKICDYIADYTYTIIKTGEYVVEDAKGMETAVFKLKKKLMKAFHSIDIKVVKK